MGTTTMSNYCYLSFIPKSIRRTTLGERYARACQICRICALEIKITNHYLRRGEIDRTRALQLIYRRRREYLRHSNEASALLDEIARTYHWPADSTADTTFTWQPARVPRGADAPPEAPPKPSDRPLAFVVPEGETLEARLAPLLKQGYRLIGITLPPSLSQPPKVVMPPHLLRGK